MQQTTEEEKWDFFYHHIESMIEDFKKISRYNEELRNHVYEFIQEAIIKSSHNLSEDNYVDLLNMAQKAWSD